MDFIFKWSSIDGRILGEVLPAGAYKKLAAKKGRTLYIQRPKTASLHIITLLRGPGLDLLRYLGHRLLGSLDFTLFFDPLDSTQYLADWLPGPLLFPLWNGCGRLNNVKFGIVQ